MNLSWVFNTSGSELRKRLRSTKFSYINALQRTIMKTIIKKKKKEYRFLVGWFTIRYSYPIITWSAFSRGKPGSSLPSPSPSAMLLRKSRSGPRVHYTCHGFILLRRKRRVHVCVVIDFGRTNLFWNQLNTL